MYRIISDQVDFLIINKDPGVSFHKEGDTVGLHEQLRSDLKTSSLYAVHRLDKMTSGLLIVAKNEDAARALSYLFRNRMIEKYYLAISDRKPRKKQGTIKGDMKKSRRGSWKLSREHKDPAITSFFSYSIRPGLRLFLLRPYTGKTHQIRVAMKSMGAPVLGDPLYHDKEGNSACDRGYLHAFGVRFMLEHKVYEFQSGPDSGEFFLDNNALLQIKKCEDPWNLTWPNIKGSKIIR